MPRRSTAAMAHVAPRTGIFAGTGRAAIDLRRGGYGRVHALSCAVGRAARRVRGGTDRGIGASSRATRACVGRQRLRRMPCPPPSSIWTAAAEQRRDRAERTCRAPRWGVPDDFLRIAGILQRLSSVPGGIGGQRQAPGKHLRGMEGQPQASRQVTCQTCHMPDRRHLWRGIHDPAMVAAASRRGSRATPPGCASRSPIPGRDMHFPHT